MSNNLVKFKVLSAQHMFFTIKDQDYACRPGTETMLPGDNEHVLSLEAQGKIKRVEAPKEIAKNIAPAGPGPDATDTGKNSTDNPEGGENNGAGSVDLFNTPPADYSKMNMDQLREEIEKRKDLAAAHGIDFTNAQTKKLIVPLLIELDEISALKKEAEEIGADIEGLTSKEDLQAAIDLKKGN